MRPTDYGVLQISLCLFDTTGLYPEMIPYPYMTTPTLQHLDPVKEGRSPNTATMLAWGLAPF